MYKFQSKQITIMDFNMPLGMELDPANRWVQKSKTIPWDLIEERYAGLFNGSTTGNVAKPLRLVLGALLIQIERRISDEELVLQIQETPALQYFCGLPGFTQKAPFDSSSMVHFRKRLTPEILEEINEMIIRMTIENETKKKGTKHKKFPSNNINHQPEQPSEPNESTPYTTMSSVSNDDTDSALLAEPAPQGTLIIDATCAPQNIRYPQDLSLLNEARENIEQMIDELHDITEAKKPRTYRKKARRMFLKIARKKKTLKDIRKGVGQQLRFVKRDIKIVSSYLATGRTLSPKRMTRFNTILKLYEQQNEMYVKHKHQIDNRIVSLGQPWIRPIVRGKARAKCEFGAKIQLSVADGFSRLERTSFDAFNEGDDFISILESYHKRNGYYPAKAMGDEIYRNQKNLAFCKQHGITMLGKPLGRPRQSPIVNKKAIRKDEIARVEIERKFSHAKGSFGLGLIKTRLQTTSKTTISLSIIALNIAYAMRLIFTLISETLKTLSENIKLRISNPIDFNNIKIAVVQ